MQRKMTGAIMVRAASVSLYSLYNDEGAHRGSGCPSSTPLLSPNKTITRAMFTLGQNWR